MISEPYNFFLKSIEEKIKCIPNYAIENGTISNLDPFSDGSYNFEIEYGFVNIFFKQIRLIREKDLAISFLYRFHINGKFYDDVGVQTWDPSYMTTIEKFQNNTLDYVLQTKGVKRYIKIKKILNIIKYYDVNQPIVQSKISSSNK